MNEWLLAALCIYLLVGWIWWVGCVEDCDDVFRFTARCVLWPLIVLRYVVVEVASIAKEG